MPNHGINTRLGSYSEKFMDPLLSLLRTPEPKILNYPAPFLKNNNPVEWAADLCRKNAQTGLRVQVMKSAVSGDSQDQSVINVKPTNTKAINDVLRAISQGMAGHANMQLFNCNSLMQVSQFEPGLYFYYKVLYEALEEIYPQGHYVKANLWFSASRHIYHAHIDKGDGFLFQLKGKKRVKVWPVPEECAKEVLFNHGDIKRRQSLPCREFDLGPGEVLFIPSGAVHEVMVDSGYCSVSVGFHVGGPYPLLTLQRDLDEMFHGEHFELPENLSDTAKSDITYFDPALHCTGHCSEESSMPETLKNVLCEVFTTDTNDKSALAQQLDEWWQEKIKRPTYMGPYPQESYDTAFNVS